MVLKADQLRVKALLKETITLLCKNGLNYRSEFAIEALIGITLDKDDVFLISIKETIDGGMGILAGGDDSTQKSNFDIDVHSAGDCFTAAETYVTNEHENSDDFQTDASNSGTTPRQLMSGQRRRRRRRSNESQGNSHCEDSAAFALPDFDIEKTHDDRDNLPIFTPDLCQERQDNEPEDKKPRLQGEVHVKKEYEEEDDDDDLIMVKEEEAPTNIGSCSYQQSHPQTGQSMSGVMSSTESVFRGSSSWTAPMPSAGSATFTSPTHCTQQADNSFLQTPNQLNTSQMSQQEATPQSAQQGELEQCKFGDALRRPRPYQCSSCPKRCMTITGLRCHEDLHRGIYRYKCPYCGKGFSGTTNLRGHMAMHTGIREFQCNLCSREFLYARQLRAHMIAKHGDDNNQTDKWLPTDK